MLFRVITLRALFPIPLMPSLSLVNGYFVKLISDGSLDRYKSRLKALGKNRQEHVIDYEETFALGANMTTARTAPS